MAATKDRKFRVIEITVGYNFTEVKCCITVVNFTYPTAFIHSNTLNVIQM